MNLDELQSVQARERQSSDLQHLRSSFYREVGEFIQELTQERARVVDGADDPFSSPEVRQLTNDIETAEQTVEAIYERRVGKVVKKASIAAAGMPVDTDGLTDEEASLFDDLVVRIENNRDNVLSVLDGDAPSVSCSVDASETETETAGADVPTDTSPAPETERSPEIDTGADATPDTEGVSAADLMGSGPEEPADPTGASPAASEADGGPEQSETTADGTPDPDADALTATDATPDSVPPEEPPAPDPDQDAASRTAVQPDEAPPGATTEATPAADERTTSDSSTTDESSEESRDIPGLPRTTVRITDDVGEVVGADNRDYDLGSEDVVTLPEPNADVLVDKGAAERLD
ncbi:DNA replication complex subunit Gins51 [Natronomonas sp.]|uniref:DNA replication complex subunit Gins51 n=1 Tax=Natronomonas sp. TaxID=2184060 RepID=UPI002FC3249A